MIGLIRLLFQSDGPSRLPNRTLQRQGKFARAIVRHAQARSPCLDPLGGPPRQRTAKSGSIRIKEPRCARLLAPCVLASLRAASRQLRSKRSEFKTSSAHNTPAGQTPSAADRAFFRTRKRSIVTGPDCPLLNGSRSILPMPEVEKRTPSPSSTGKT